MGEHSGLFKLINFRIFYFYILEIYSIRKNEF